MADAVRCLMEERIVYYASTKEIPVWCPLPDVSQSKDSAREDPLCGCKEPCITSKDFCIKCGRDIRR